MAITSCTFHFLLKFQEGNSLLSKTTSDYNGKLPLEQREQKEKNWALENNLQLTILKDDNKKIKWSILTKYLHTGDSESFNICG